MTRKPVDFRPMTDDERRCATALGMCAFVPGSFDKRFAQALGADARTTVGTISDKQSALLFKMVVRYRRQIHADDVAIARTHLDSAGVLP